MVEYFAECVDMPNFNQDDISKWISTVVNDNGKELGELSIIFCNDDYILNVNREYLNHDYFTDIITFDYCDYLLISGDLFISIDTVFDNSKKFNTKYDDELMRVIIHGVLHLIGFKDKTDEEQKEMTNQENISLYLLDK